MLKTFLIKKTPQKGEFNFSYTLVVLSHLSSLSSSASTTQSSSFLASSAHPAGAPSAPGCE
ncbi:hypothetical protein HOF65_08540 [bacterium]|nr:hypothetical protein [bacterium]MBT4633305.1 hypothetical protein [bacterium]MBT6779062.1 hypothetical protein [bacterium]